MTEDHDALRRIVSEMATAWNAGDGDGLAAAFVDDADFIHILGLRYTGRVAVAEAHRTILTTIYKGSRVSLDVEKIRFLRPDVAAIFLLGRLTVVVDENQVQLQTRPTFIAHKTDGAWQIVVFQNTMVGGMASGEAAPVMERHPYRPG
jgi:uncharacterized protein (TIGR02246 family)